MLTSSPIALHGAAFAFTAMLNPENFRRLGLAVIETETAAVRALADRVDGRFIEACTLMLACEGRLVVTGMGKSGHIAGKIAATLASTGSPAFFVHPGEASHGDLGMITRKDVVVALSNSGETDELLRIVPLIKRLGAPLILLTGNLASSLAQVASVVLDVSVAQEACPLGLAPTSSTTAALVMGDALAIALLEVRGFSSEDFARAHPGGRLGRRLLLHVEDIMRKAGQLPQVGEQTPLKEALIEISRKGLGFTAVIGTDNRVIGVYTDGDLRRTLDRNMDIRELAIGEVMSRQFKSIAPERLAAEALKLMEDHKVNALPVIDAHGTMVGALNMHDLLRAGVV
jgi:arabinose-5-phosphate isomerase